MSLFKVQEHTLTTSHIREYPGATAGSQDDELKLAVKQYTPRDNQDPKPGDVTIIGGHANGFPKVLHFGGKRIPVDDTLILRRNYTSPFGTNYIKSSRRRASKSAASGSRMSRIRVLAEC